MTRGHSRRFGEVTLFVAIFSAVWGIAVTGASAEEDSTALIQPDKPTSVSASDARAFVVKLNDGGEMRVTLMDEEIVVASRYGTLKVAATDIRAIEFARPIPPETQKKIDDSLAAMMGSEEKDREAAAMTLVGLGREAYPAVAKAASDPKAPGVRMATAVLTQIEEATADSEALPPTDVDVIRTVDSTIAGHLVTRQLKVHTTQFGDLSLGVGDALAMRSKSYVEFPAETPEPTAVATLNDGEALVNYQAAVGTKFRFRVNGRIGMHIWGSQIYTLDTPLGPAAVHAGVIGPNQSGVVTVEIVQAPPSFAGATLNGVTSHPWGQSQFQIAYRIIKGPRGRGTAPGKAQGPPAIDWNDFRR